MATDLPSGPDRCAQETEVLIIGAGPAGLALATQLQQRRIPFSILEKGSIGDSWRRMPPSLKLVSPWKTNWLSADDGARHENNAQLTRSEFLGYLRDYAAANEVRVQTHCEVFAISREENRFRVHTSEGQFICRIVVSATGYFSNPVRPLIAGADATTILQLHYADYRGPEQIRSIAGTKATVLLLGKRLSAGQTLLELIDGGFPVALSHRAPIQFGCSDWLWPLAYRSFPYVEAIKLKLSRGRAPKLDVRMPGGRAKRLIVSGAVQTFPAIARFDRHAVVFTDGRKLQPGLVFYATGFAPALGHLAPLNLPVCPETGAPLTRDMESIEVPNLFLIGFEMLRNFQSRFLRGIRNDAVALADKIEGRPRKIPVPGVAELCAA